MDKLEIIAHRGHWAGITALQNSLGAMYLAEVAGFSVELDLRLSKNGEILLMHDKDVKLPEKLEDGLPHIGKLSSIFFHIKDNEFEMLDKLTELFKKYNALNIRFFGLSEKAKKAYAKVFGWEKIMYELETGVKGTIKEAIESNSDIVWYAPNKTYLNSSEIGSLIKAKKIVYMVTPEVFGNDLANFEENFDLRVKGLCTDLPNYYKNEFT
jgi:hypothetical protein